MAGPGLWRCWDDGFNLSDRGKTIYYWGVGEEKDEEEVVVVAKDN